MAFWQDLLHIKKHPTGAFLSGISIDYLHFLEITNLFGAFFKLGEYVVKRKLTNIHHNHKVINQVVYLAVKLGFVGILCCNYCFGTFLAYLFEHLIKSLFKEVAGV